jgi:hypothetical protein
LCGISLAGVGTLLTGTAGRGVSGRGLDLSGDRVSKSNTYNIPVQTACSFILPTFTRTIGYVVMWKNMKFVVAGFSTRSSKYVIINRKKIVFGCFLITQREARKDIILNQTTSYRSFTHTTVFMYMQATPE